MRLLLPILLLMGGCAATPPLQHLSPSECAARCGAGPDHQCEDFIVKLEQMESTLRACKVSALQSFMDRHGVKTTVNYGE